jgi:hypothetical protein
MAIIDLGIKAVEAAANEVFKKSLFFHLYSFKVF